MPPRGAKERALETMARFRRAYGPRYAYLAHGSPFQLLVAVILSAQAPDAVVNRVTPALFAAYPTARAMAQAPEEELRRLVEPVSFARSKARHLRGAARLLVERHGGEVPRAMEDLVALPGVGRKTASVVQGYVWGEAEAVAVDTHVRRVSFRLGLTTREDPDQVAEDLGALYPPRDWPDVNFFFIRHGRAVCVARRPRCGECLVADLCPRRGVTAVAAGPGAQSPPPRKGRAAKG